MTPRGINTNQQNVRRFPRVVLCLVLISCINFGGTNISAKQQELSDTWKNLSALNEPGMEDKFISVNFDQVDIRIMLKTIGDITGTNFVVDDAIQGKVTVMSPGRIRLGEIFKVLESVLEVNDYAAIVDGDFVRIVPNSKAIKQHRNVRVGGDPERIPQGSDYVTQIIPLKYANVGEISDIINPLLATGSYMSTYPKTNSIIITGNSSNIHHIAAIIQKLDTQGIEEHVEVITLEHASSEVLAEQIC
jgi:general secretion pathway protein D